MKRIVCWGVVTLLASASLGHAQSLPAPAPPPNMLGVWKPTGVTAAARIGASVAGWPQTSKPAFNLKPRPYVVVNVETGREIAGYEIFADGKREPFVGVFTLAGKLLVNTLRGTASVDLYGNQIEWCWQDTLTNVAIVSCDVMRKQPSSP
jgi:hypothetical protein